MDFMNSKSKSRKLSPKFISYLILYFFIKGDLNLIDYAKWRKNTGSATAPLSMVDQLLKPNQTCIIPVKGFTIKQTARENKKSKFKPMQTFRKIPICHHYNW